MADSTPKILGFLNPPMAIARVSYGLWKVVESNSHQLMGKDDGLELKGLLVSAACE